LVPAHIKENGLFSFYHTGKAPARKKVGKGTIIIDNSQVHGITQKRKKVAIQILAGVL
jgi:hypothetical protein